MTAKTYLKVTGIFFSIITLVHLARIVYGWEAVIGGWTIPLEISYLAAIVGGYLAYSAYKLSQ